MTLGLLAALAALAAPEGAQTITGTIEGDASLLRGGDVIFLSARPEGATGGPPTWVRRLDVPALPLPFTLGPENAMMGGPVPEKLVLTARLDRDGDAMSRGPGDAFATSPAVPPGAQDLRLRLEAAGAPSEAPPGGALRGDLPPPQESAETPSSAELPPGVVAGVDPARVIGPPAGPAPSGEVLRQRTLEAARLLRCVVCQGLSVADSPSETARAMRDQVQALVEKGYDTEQVLTWFEASYGAFVRLEPTSEGINGLVWAGPGVAMLLGLGFIATRTRTSPAADAPGTGGDEPLAPWLARVRADTRPADFDDAGGAS
jgi:cytochrome c-type biogenesis protein CcmH